MKGLDIVSCIRSNVTILHVTLLAFKKHRWNSACYDLPMYTAIRRAPSQIQTASHLHSRLHVSAINLGNKKRKSVY